MIFGFLDLAQKFHPIAFMFTSHETQSDFSQIYVFLERPHLEIEIDKIESVQRKATRIKIDFE